MGKSLSISGPMGPDVARTDSRAYGPLNGPQEPSKSGAYIGAMKSCQYHCRAFTKDGCGAHFQSLAAFEAHRVGPPEARRCSFPDDVEFVETTGVCKISDPSTPKVGITIYGLAVSETERERLDKLSRAA